MDADIISKRIDALLSRTNQAVRGEFGILSELLHATISVIQAMYGLDSIQQRSFIKDIEQTKSAVGAMNSSLPTYLTPIIRGSLEAMKAEISSDFFGSLQASLTGDLLTDLIKLSRRVMDEEGDDAKNVGAVLAAASFEDTIRRIADKHSVPDLEKLADVITELKNRQVLQGPQVGIAQSYLSFRNKALHARWADIERPAVSSVLAFTEELILIHFSKEN